MKLQIWVIFECFLFDKETTDFCCKVRIKNRKSCWENGTEIIFKLSIHMPWFFSCQIIIIKKTSLPGVVIQDLKMHISYTMKEKIKHTVSNVWHEPSADTSWRLNTMQTVISSRMWSQVQTCWKQAAATWLIKTKAGIVQISYSLKTLLHHVYTNNLSFFTERAFTFAPVRDARKTKHLKHAIKACINKCMYKRKCGEKAQALKMCFLTLAEWYFPARQEKKPLGRQRRTYKTNKSSAIAFVWSGRDACVFSTHFISRRVGSHLLERR